MEDYEAGLRIDPQNQECLNGRESVMNSADVPMTIALLREGKGLNKVAIPLCFPIIFSGLGVSMRVLSRWVLNIHVGINM